MASRLPFSRRNPRRELVSVLLEARKLLARPGNNFIWTHWEGTEHSLAELDALIAEVTRGQVPKSMLQTAFAPTGPIQEVSVTSGWGQEFLDISSRFDAALERLLASEGRSAWGYLRNLPGRIKGAIWR
jgi:hypothetical protein